MSGNSLSQQKAQLDKAEREHLEDVIAEMRERVEDNVRFQLTQSNLDTGPSDDETLDDETQQLVDAIELEAVDDTDWDEAFEEYIDGVGYTIVNRLAALRCMEVRDFIDQEVTVFKQNGLTPAAETLVHEEFLLEDEAILAAYHNTCDELAAEIEILFDRSTAYSLVDPDDDTFEELCGMLDEVPDEVWRADDVLGWVYEYYNRSVVEALDTKNTLEPEDVGPANQFYTPHWVVRMLTDNSLGKLYLEATNQESTVAVAESLSVEDRKERLVTPEDAPSVAELCTYLIPDDDKQEAPKFDHPSELRVIDPACGSGHFLLYAFDILERIWWAETDLDRAVIPAKILEHNLYGVDIDLRSCQLSAFNLYLKARTRAEAEDNPSFEMPNIGIVCANARVAEVEEAVDVLDQIASDGTEVREALDGIIEEFQSTEALGSLLDVQGTLSEEFMEAQSDVMEWSGEGPHTLHGFLKELREAVDERASDSFGEQNLRSFLNLLVVLTQDYDVALMNPPYGMRGRMPNNVKKYVKENYEYYQEYYVNFFEACENLSKTNGRVGMLIPWSFMFRKVFESFRTDFVSSDRRFDFLAEFGYGVLDNATVGTVGTVVRVDTSGKGEGDFIRLHDVPKDKKEEKFAISAFETPYDGSIKRRFQRDMSEFSIIPGAPVSYWVPKELRKLYEAETVLDSDNAELPDRKSVGDVKVGLQSGDDSRFLPYFWEIQEDVDSFPPVSNGGSDTWLLPKNSQTINWGNDGTEVRRYAGSYLRSPQLYFSEGITFNRRKRSGRHFGYMHSKSIFTESGTAIFPDEIEPWPVIGYLNSRLITYLKLAQTFERKWETGTVSRLPVIDAFFKHKAELTEAAKKQVANVIAQRSHNFTSPHFSGCLAAQIVGYAQRHPPEHPHRSLLNEVDWRAPPKTSPDTSFEEITEIAEQYLFEIEESLEKVARETDQMLFDYVGIPEKQQRKILQEVQLRTIDDPLTQKEQNDSQSSSSRETKLTTGNIVKDLLLQLSMEIVQEDDDGIIPLSPIDGEPNLLTRLEAEFERIWGDHATDRLAEVDQLLGSKTADEEAYPNLREWLKNDLFDYHVSKFDRTPILWRLTTSRLVSDPEGEGFACLVDYHQLDAGVFDRLQNRYLEPRKALLRERRSAANRRRSDDSLSTSEKATAAEEYDRCESGLEQIGVFEDRLAELAQPTPREWSTEEQQTAQDAIEPVTEFREQTASRLETLEELAALDDVDMEELFTPSFYETVQENQDEWLDALADLEAALEAYAADGSEPVEAHLYDLFEYYDDLIGSTHFASNGILFMTYYFDKFEDAGQAELSNSGISKRERLCSELARDLDEYKELADKISDACNGLSKDVSSDWADRALSEITTTGYDPNRKHGVEINITPLAEAEIVPKTVDDKVL